ncbi:hypothetical protein PGTUg99_010041 [Puccinia graminis f. sp. tritici]|uniref:Uncharacterized protein n=1 Tax=Puccinia graminis f. sp. tritici TaxID=56615 RepID=A0A5B0R5U9_PUCGR|nr:hypothetical protein PGTUg99_010041 [Puccinia graminis f. sp. tritici]
MYYLQRIFVTNSTKRFNIDILDQSPHKTAKPVKKVVKKAEKQYTSPEVIPSEWDQDSHLTSKSEKLNSTRTRVVKTKINSITISSTNRATPIDKAQTKPDPVKEKSDEVSKPVKLIDPVPSTDPFKSKEEFLKLIDKDLISHLTFKRIDQQPQSKIGITSPIKSIDIVRIIRTSYWLYCGTIAFAGWFIKSHSSLLKSSLAGFSAARHP